MDETGVQTGDSPAHGRALCLDFTNTVDWRVRAEPVESLTRPADLVAWAREAGMLADAAAAELLTWPALARVHICAGADCGWLFLDQSRNASRRWCAMDGCGNRTKARRHYHRSVKRNV